MPMVRLRLRVGQGDIRLQKHFFGQAGGRLWKNQNFTVMAAWDSAGFDRSRYNDAVTVIERAAKTTGFRIRDFRVEDFDALWQMDQQCFPPGISYSRQELKFYIRKPSAFTLVAETLAGKAAKAQDPENPYRIVGFLVGTGGPTGHIITIDVVSDARRTGVGSVLLSAAEGRLRAGGSQAVGLETAVDNAAALSFYKRHGYSVVRTWPRYYSNGVDALVLKKQLSAKS